MTKAADNSKVIALFDFDGTITTKDSLGAFLVFNFGLLKCILAGLVYLPVHLLYKVRLISSTTAKNFLLPFFFKGVSIADFQKMCLGFCIKKLPGILQSEALEKIKWHQQQGHEIAVVTASIYNWIAPWATSVGIGRVIASRAEVVDGKLSGKLLGKNCNHEEKVIRIQEAIPGIEAFEIYAYGNSKGDRFMLELADQPFYKKFSSS